MHKKLCMGAPVDVLALFYKNNKYIPVYCISALRIDWPLSTAPIEQGVYAWCAFGCSVYTHSDSALFYISQTLPAFDSYMYMYTLTINLYHLNRL